MRKEAWVALSLALMAISSAAGMARMARAGSDDLFVEWVWCDGDLLPPGRTSSVNLTIRNPSANPIKLQFVGLRFDWMPQNAYVYGGGSELEAILPPKGSVRYAIPFEIPPDVVPGFHECLAIAKYEVLGEVRFSIFRPDRGLSVLRVITLTEVVTKTETIIGTGEQGHGYAASALIGLAILAAVLLLSKLRLKGRPSGGTAAGG
ncbi:MAG: hypothetical protein QXQ76_00590 [Candidatus Bathyarchaeia archaeon]